MAVTVPLGSSMASAVVATVKLTLDALAGITTWRLPSSPAATSEPAWATVIFTVVAVLAAVAAFSVKVAVPPSVTDAALRAMVTAPAVMPASVMVMRARPAPLAPPARPLAVMRGVPLAEDAGMVTVTASLAASEATLSAFAVKVMVAVVSLSASTPVKVRLLPASAISSASASARLYSERAARPATPIGTTRLSPATSLRERVTVNSAVASLSPPSVAVASVAAMVTTVGSSSATATDAWLVPTL